MLCLIPSCCLACQAAAESLGNFQVPGSLIIRAACLWKHANEQEHVLTIVADGHTSFPARSCLLQILSWYWSQLLGAERCKAQVLQIYNILVNLAGCIECASILSVRQRRLARPFHVEGRMIGSYFNEVALITRQTFFSS